MAHVKRLVARFNEIRLASLFNWDIGITLKCAANRH